MPCTTDSPMFIVDSAMVTPGFSLSLQTQRLKPNSGIVGHKWLSVTCGFDVLHISDLNETSGCTDLAPTSAVTCCLRQPRFTCPYLQLTAPLLKGMRLSQSREVEMGENSLLPCPIPWPSHSLLLTVGKASDGLRP